MTGNEFVRSFDAHAQGNGRTAAFVCSRVGSGSPGPAQQVPETCTVLSTMANAEHLAVLNHSLQEQRMRRWNDWRKENLRIKPDLSGVFFSNPFLYYADLSRANLKDTVFLEPNLNGASLQGAILDGASLFDPLLIDSDFSGAYLRHTYFITSQNTPGDLQNRWSALRRDVDHKTIFLPFSLEARGSLAWGPWQSAPQSLAAVDRTTSGPCRSPRTWGRRSADRR